MYIGDDDSITRPCVFYEVDVNQDFELKQKIYENQELFFKPQEDTNTSKPTEIQEIEDNVKKGRDMLLTTIKSRNELEIQRNHVKTNIKESLKAYDLIFSEVSFLAGILRKYDIPEEDVVSALFEKSRQLKSKVCVALREKKNDIEQRINEYDNTIRQLGNVYGILKSAGLNYMCSICLTNTVDVFCDPCGHTYCESCIKSNYCFLCRVKIDKVKKLYLS